MKPFASILVSIGIAALLSACGNQPPALSGAPEGGAVALQAASGSEGGTFKLPAQTHWMVQSAAMTATGAFNGYALSGVSKGLGHHEPFELSVKVGQPNTRVTGYATVSLNGNNTWTAKELKEIGFALGNAVPGPGVDPEIVGEATIAVLQAYFMSPGSY